MLGSKKLKEQMDALLSAIEVYQQEILKLQKELLEEKSKNQEV
jgi:hypothetical protein